MISAPGFDNGLSAEVSATCDGLCELGRTLGKNEKAPGADGIGKRVWSELSLPFYSSDMFLLFRGGPI